MNYRQRDLYYLIRDTLDSDELMIVDKRRRALTDALGRLKRGENITSEQAGYWSAVRKQIMKDKIELADIFEFE